LSLVIAVNGALGRIGMELANIIFADASLSLGACIDRPGHPDIGKDYGVCIGKGPIGIPVKDRLDPPFKGVIIDFSSPQSTRELLARAAELKAPMVIGTTGLTESDFDLARKAAHAIPVLVSPNMSLGVNLLFSLTRRVAAQLKNDFDIEIIETHHRFKKDAPSGTARRLGEIAAEAIGSPYEKAVRNGRSGISKTTRQPDEIGMHAVRGGDIVGDHTVLFAGIGERIELRHMAHSRAIFARGAIHVAQWLADKNCGYYSMEEVLNV
jgi:4-hydroxy-tetrahydrodipicolinate reductase